MSILYGFVGWSAVCGCCILYHTHLLFKHNVGLKLLLKHGISEPIFQDSLVNKFKGIVRKHSTPNQFKTPQTKNKNISNHILTRYSLCTYSILVSIELGYRIDTPFNAILELYFWAHME